MSILHIAQKNSIAKQVANVLSQNSKRTVHTDSKYNPVYQFDLQSQKHHFSSVRGHVFEHDLPPQCRSWRTYDNKKILNQQVGLIKKCGFNMEDVIKNIQRLGRNHKQLILWLDCDREGQAIAFEVIQICEKVNPRIKIKRARFAAVTATDVWNAYNALVSPNKLESDAVLYRMQIDFRSGCTFTRYQTMAIQDHYSFKNVISYGPCQIPTLSFVVKRYLQIKNFKPEKYWVIQMSCVIDDATGIPFTWNRGNTKNQIQANQYIVKLLSPFPDGDVQGQVTNRRSFQKKKSRPFPLTTVKFQKLATDKLRMSSARAMEIAQKLYQNGLISYPRTQTNAFPKTFNLKSLIQRHENSSVFGEYVKKLLQLNKYVHPKTGAQNDQAHTPIHPVKMAERGSMEQEHWKVYDLIVRSFLACCSGDAIGQQFQVKADVSGEGFKASYLTIKQKNFLEIYPFQKWIQTSFPANIPDRFPAQINMKQSKTTPPGYLTESDLITLMQKNQIGTDSTIHEHIQTIQVRNYAIKTGNTFKPTNLGASLVQTHQQMDIALAKCQVRRKMQQKMNLISQGGITRDNAVKETLGEMVVIYERMISVRDRWIQCFKKYMGENSQLHQVNTDGGGGGNGGNDDDRGNGGGGSMRPNFRPNNNMGSQQNDENSRTNQSQSQTRNNFNSNVLPRSNSHQQDRQNNNNTNGWKNKQIVCFRCQQKGHYAPDCPNKGEQPQNSRPKVTLSEFKSGFPQQQQKTKKNNTSSQNGGTKVCKFCGIQGRHPRGSNCQFVVKNRKQKDSSQDDR